MPENGEILSLRETQMAAFNVFQRFHALCEEHGLRYWLAYGTLIGALRHRGFIPWDDDLDVYMPRPDYDKLLSLFGDMGDRLDSFKLICNRPARSVPFLIARMSDIRYKMIGETGLDLDDMGAFIDIYPVDGLGNDFRAAVNLKEECFELMMRYLRAGNFACNNVHAKGAKRLMKKMVGALYGNPERYAGRQLSLLHEHDFLSSDYVAVAVWGIYGIQRSMIFDREDFSESIEVEFEGMQTYAPIGYDAILRKRYGGDYMQLPPESERVSHHNYRLIAKG